MVLVQLLGLLLPAVQCWDKVLCEANQPLDDKQDVGDETEDGVRRYKVDTLVRNLVIFDND